MKRSLSLIACLMVINAGASINEEFLALWPITPDIDITSESFVAQQEERAKNMQLFIESSTQDNPARYDASMHLYISAVCQVGIEASKIEGMGKKLTTLNKVLASVDTALVALSDGDIIKMVQASSIGLAGAYQRYLAAWAVLNRDLDDKPVSSATREIVTKSIKLLSYELISGMRSSDDDMSMMFFANLALLDFEKAELKKTNVEPQHVDKAVFQVLIPEQAANLLKRSLPAECAKTLNFDVVYLGLNRRMMLNALSNDETISMSMFNYWVQLQKSAATLTRKEQVSCAQCKAAKTLVFIMLDAIAHDQLVPQPQPAA